MSDCVCLRVGKANESLFGCKSQSDVIVVEFVGRSFQRPQNERAGPPERDVILRSACQDRLRVLSRKNEAEHAGMERKRRLNVRFGSVCVRFLRGLFDYINAADGTWRQLVVDQTRPDIHLISLDLCSFLIKDHVLGEDRVVEGLDRRNVAPLGLGHQGFVRQGLETSAAKVHAGLPAPRGRGWCRCGVR